jgi:hypothetical protein
VNTSIGVGSAGDAGWQLGVVAEKLAQPVGDDIGGQGTPLHVVSEVLGHASIAITKDVYGHLLEGDKRAAAESMTRALFGG